MSHERHNGTHAGHIDASLSLHRLWSHHYLTRRRRLAHETSSRRGNKVLKRALFFPTFAPLTGYPAARSYYDKKRAKGKRHNQAIIALSPPQLRRHLRDAQRWHFLRIPNNTASPSQRLRSWFAVGRLQRIAATRVCSLVEEVESTLCCIIPRWVKDCHDRVQGV